MATRTCRLDSISIGKLAHYTFWGQACAERLHNFSRTRRKRRKRRRKSTRM